MYKKILTLAKTYEQLAKKSVDISTSQFTSEDVKHILFKAGLFPVARMPGPGEPAQLDVNANVLNKYVWPVIDQLSGGKPVDIYMTISPGGKITLSSNIPAIAQHNKIRGLARAMTAAMRGQGPAETIANVPYATGLQ